MMPYKYILSIAASVCFRCTLAMISCLLLHATTFAQFLTINPAFKIDRYYRGTTKTMMCGINPYKQYFTINPTTKELIHQWNYPGDKDKIPVEEMQYDAGKHEYLLTLPRPRDLKRYTAVAKLDSSGQLVELVFEKLGKEKNAVPQTDTYTSDLGQLSFTIICDAYKYLPRAGKLRGNSAEAQQEKMAFLRQTLLATRDTLEIEPGRLTWTTLDSTGAVKRIPMAINSTEFGENSGNTWVTWHCKTDPGVFFFAKYYDVTFGKLPFYLNPDRYADHRTVGIFESILNSQIDVRVLIPKW